MALGTYIITAPIWPSATKSIQQIIPVEISFHTEPIGADTLEIPSIGVNEALQEGGRVWLTSESNFSGNIVVAGHRFLYSDPISPPFYFLNKIAVGDRISLRYSGTVYEYSAIKKFEVGSKDTWIEKDYSFPTITLYTCTPIYNPINRLVIVGKLVSIH